VVDVVGLLPDLLARPLVAAGDLAEHPAHLVHHRRGEALALLAELPGIALPVVELLVALLDSLIEPLDVSDQLLNLLFVTG
jgi:hypothetical protein